MAEVFFLGSGGSVATVDRDNTSFLIDHDDILILVDCPGSVLQKIKKLGFDPAAIQTILVTHTHPDHIYGLPSLIHGLMLMEMAIDLYGSEKTIDFCRRLLDLFHLLDAKIKCRVNFIAIGPNTASILGQSIRFVGLPVPHASSSLAYHFTFSLEQKTLLYSGDTPVHPPLFEKAKDIDFLIHDCSAPSRFFKRFPSLKTMHTNSLELGKHALQAGVGCLIPCHFFGEIDYSMSEIEQEIRENYKGDLILPSDFMRIVL
ncbi:MAG: MBL fold metallo-hydrolase [Candidatus Aminicenantes bacterium]|nr:MBL fold metallo-hydrolase [Candidatus Aminicenantes bacterium]